MTLSASSGFASAREDATSRSETITATVATTATTPLVIDAVYDTDFFSSVVVTMGAAVATFTIAVTTRSDLPIGARSSSVQLRACQQADCTNVYPGSSATYTLTVTVNPSEWVTYQRNAAHTGYVHAILDPRRFVKAWESAPLPDLNRKGGMIAVEGSVYFTAGTRLHSLSEATGAQNWVYEPTDAASALGAPGYHNGRVYVALATRSSNPFSMGDSVIRGLDAATGTTQSNSTFVQQTSTFNSPTFQDGAMFFIKGYYGDRAYRYALPSGATIWDRQQRSGYDAAQAPAVDHNQVYFGVVNGVIILDKANGTELPNNPPFGGSTVGETLSPILTARGHVVIRDLYGSSRLIAIDRKTRTRAWTGRTGYPYQPVTAGNVIYAFHADNTATIDAISDTDGTVLWSWALPANEQIGPHENMILTENLLFVGTLKNVYAVDLTTRQVVWTYPLRGQLVMSSGLVLYIFNREFLADSKVIAIKLT